MNSEIVVIPVDQLRQILTDAFTVAMRKEKETAATPPPAIGNEYLPELLTRQQTAAYLGVAVGTVDNYTKDGLLSKKKVGLRAVRFDRAEVQKLARAI
jgi:excisionase family DNA binding protein